MPTPVGWAVRFAGSPSGRKVLKTAIRTARSEEGRKLLAQARTVASSAEGRRLIEQAKRVGKSAGLAATSPENRTRFDALRDRLRVSGSDSPDNRSE